MTQKVTGIVFLVDKSTKMCTYAGAVPKTYKNATGLEGLDYATLRDLGEVLGEDYKNLGFLTEMEARQMGVLPATINQMKAGAWEIKWSELAADRFDLIQAQRWRIDRHNDEVAMNKTPTEDITSLLDYIQALRDLPTTCPDPFAVVWPVVPH